MQSVAKASNASFTSAEKGSNMCFARVARLILDNAAWNRRECLPSATSEPEWHSSLSTKWISGSA